MDSIEYMLNVCSEVLPYSCKEAVLGRLKRIDNEKRLSSHTFRITHKLSEAIEKKDSIETIELFKLFSKVEKAGEDIQYTIADERHIPKKSSLFFKISDDVHTSPFIEVDSKEINTAKAAIKHCLEVVNLIDPMLHREIREIVSVIILFNTRNTEAGSTIYSGSTFNSIGSIYINSSVVLKPWYFWLDKLIHESAHQILLSIMIYDCIIENPDNERYTSPLRREPRTLTGIYHAAFVLYRIVLAFKRLIDKNELCGSDGKEISDMLKNNILCFNDAYKTIKDNGKLTTLGRDLITNCKIGIESIERASSESN